MKMMTFYIGIESAIEKFHYYDQGIDLMDQFQFTSSFRFYREKSKASASEASAASTRGFENYFKKRRTADGDADGVEEFVRYFKLP